MTYSLHLPPVWDFLGDEDQQGANDVVLPAQASQENCELEPTFQEQQNGADHPIVESVSKG